MLVAVSPAGTAILVNLDVSPYDTARFPYLSLKRHSEIVVPSVSNVVAGIPQFSVLHCRRKLWFGLLPSSRDARRRMGECELISDAETKR